MELSVEVLDSLDSDQIHAEVTTCWMEVSNAGGAVGFPFPPIGFDVVSSAVTKLAGEVDHGIIVFIEARLEGALVGWVTLRLNQSPLTSHWGSVERLQSHPNHRGLGIGAALLEKLVERSHYHGLEHLLLAVRDGEGLERFYERLGWTEVGRHPDALRLRAKDDRDEILMFLNLRP